MNNEHLKAEQKQIQYNTNPFSLIFDAFSRAFKINQNVAITVLVGGIIIYVGNQIFSNIPDILNTIGEGSSKELSVGLGIASLLFSLGYIVVATVIDTLWRGFTAYAGLKNARWESTGFKDSFSQATKAFWKVICISIISGLWMFAYLLPSIFVMIVGIVLLAADQTAAGTGVLISAGILFVVGLVFSQRFWISRTLSYFAAFDENLGVFASMDRSKQLTKNRLMEMWGVTFAAAIVPIISPVLTAFGIGMYYLQLKVYRDHKVELPKTHILSWLPVMLFGLIALFVIPIGLLVLLAYTNR